MTGGVVVVGQLARDLVLEVGDLPEPGSAGDVSSRHEMLGGKGANQAVAVAQLGEPVSLVAVAGADVIGDQLLAQASRDGVDVSRVVRRDGATTGLIVEVLEDGGTWRYLQHLPEPVLLTAADVEAAGDLLRRAGAVVVQLQQPAAAIEACVRLAREGDALIVIDGVPGDDVLDAADVVRADAHEAELLTGVESKDAEALIEAARKILDRGPRLVALGVDDGNLFVWPEGHLLLPHEGPPPVDTTGGGDSFTAALTVALLRGEAPPEAARRAVGASARTVRRPGGRPDLEPWA